MSTCPDKGASAPEPADGCDEEADHATAVQKLCSATWGEHTRTHAGDNRVHTLQLYCSISGDPKHIVALCDVCSQIVYAVAIAHAVGCSIEDLRMLGLSQNAATSDKLVFYTAIPGGACSVLHKFHERLPCDTIVAMLVDDITFKAHIASACSCMRTVGFVVPDEVPVLLDAGSPLAYTRADCEKAAMHPA